MVSGDTTVLENVHVKKQKRLWQDKKLNPVIKWHLNAVWV